MRPNIQVAVAVAFVTCCLSQANPGSAPTKPPGVVTLPTGGPSWRVESELAGALYGWSVAAAGDVNGDGFADLIIGAPDYDLAPSGSNRRGRAFVYPGSALGPAKVPLWTHDGAQNHFGVSVSSAGDVNGDGFDDIIVGEPDLSIDPSGQFLWGGQATLYLGSSTGPGDTPAWSAHGGFGDHFGAAVASAGDVNGDGYADVIVGAPGDPQHPGHAYLYLGGAGGLDPIPAWTAGSDAFYNGTDFGVSVAGAGDVNGDGYDDVIVGEPSYPFLPCTIGRAFVYFGSSSGVSGPAWVVLGGGNCNDPPFYTHRSSLGRTTATAGDVNGDHFADILIDGQLFMGSSAGPRTPPALQLPGHARRAGDVDGDSYDDVIVASATFSHSLTQEIVSLYLGSAAGLSATPAWVYASPEPGSGFGASVDGAGDTDGDGLANFIIGAPFYDDGETDEGAAFLAFGPGVITCEFDTDADGYCAGGPDADCDDTDPAVHPNTTERCNGIDDNCDGAIDEGFDVGGACNVGYGICAKPGVLVCASPDATTCGGPAPGPPSPEVCDGSDNDCDGLIDDNLPDDCRIASVTHSQAALGSSVADAGDVNGDGFGDVLAGAPGDGNGRVYLYYGNAAGRFRSADWSIEGTQTAAAAGRGARFGAAVAGIGDLNHDGYADFIVGAPQYDYVTYAGNTGSLGAVSLFLGSPQGPQLSGFTTGSPSPFSSAYGYRVARGGDIDRNGVGDYLISQGRTFMLGPPSVHVVLGGRAEQVLTDNDSSSGFGAAIAGGCDINGDGFPDVVVGAPAARRVSIYYGGSLGVGTTPVLVLSGPTGFGSALSCSGDLNHDRFADLAVADSTGVVTVRLGSREGLDTTPVWSSDGGQGGSSFGTDVELVRDVNGDGFADLMVGAPTYNAGQMGQGAVFVYPGGPDGPSTTPLLVATPVDQPGGHLGFSVSGAGDYNKDGLPDLLAGAPDFNSGGAPGSGRVDLLLTAPPCHDADGDGSSTCGPIGMRDCDDLNPAVHPGVVEICNGLDDDCNGTIDDAASPGTMGSISLSSSATEVTWSALAAAQHYDVVYGDLTQLLDSGGNFTISTLGCVADNSPSTSATFSDNPVAGRGFWILVRGNNCGGAGTYDGEAGQVGSRDAGIAASSSACP
jgi:hypothetical protein